MTAPKVSVIIPAYNYGRFIADAIRSLQQQSFTDFECIIVDDGSTDETRSVVEHLAGADARIKYIFQPNAGQPAARNTGLRRATGTYLQFLDADDMLQPEKLRSQVEFLDLHRDVDIVYGDVLYFEEPDVRVYFLNRWGNRDESWMPRTSGRGESMVQEFVSGNIFELGCALFRAEVVLPYGRFSLWLQGVEDYEYCFRLALANRTFTYLGFPGAAVLMRHHTGSFSKSLITMYKAEINMRRTIDDQLRSTYPAISKINRNRKGQRLRQLQELLIDRRIKKQQHHLPPGLLYWIWVVSSFPEKWYFFPRWVKASIAGGVHN